MTNENTPRSQRAAGTMRDLRASEQRTRRMIVMGTIVVVLVMAVAVFAVIYGQRDTTGATADATPSGVDGYTIRVGDPDAPTTVSIYEDLQCPACASFESQVGPAVRAAVESGDIAVDYHMVSFLDQASSTDYSSRALNAALAVLDTAGVDAFTTFHDDLFANQPPEGGAGLTDEELIDRAVQAGADEDEVRPQIEDKIYDQWIVNATDQMSKDGINGTPGFKIDGKDAEATDVVELVR